MSEPERIPEKAVEAIAAALYTQATWHPPLPPSKWANALSPERTAWMHEARGLLAESVVPHIIEAVVEALRAETDFYEGKVAGSEDKRLGYALGFYEAADFIEREFGGE